MCRRLFCAVPNEPGLYQAIFAMEKTSCGDGKWCQLGQCVRHASAPRLRDSCPQGDDPTAPCVREDCPYYTVRTKLVYCCKTCLNARASPPTPAPPPLPSHLLSSAPWLGLISNGISDTQIVRRVGPLMGVGGPLMGVGGPLMGVGGPLMEVGGPLMEVGGPLMGVGGPLMGVEVR